MDAVELDQLSLVIALLVLAPEDALAIRRVEIGVNEPRRHGAVRFAPLDPRQRIFARADVQILERLHDGRDVSAPVAPVAFRRMTVCPKRPPRPEEIVAINNPSAAARYSRARAAG